MGDKERNRALMIEVVYALKDMRDPFDHSFLVEHQVTADEIYMIAEALANAYEVVMLLMGHPVPERD